MSPTAPGRRVLIVDDNVAFANVLRRSLTSKGYACGVVQTVASAIDAIEQNTFDVVLTDLALGSESGVRVLEYVTEHAPGTIAILMTGSLDEYAASQSKERSAAPCLLKPFRVDELCELIEELAGLSPMRRRFLPPRPIRASVPASDRRYSVDIEGDVAIIRLYPSGTGDRDELFASIRQMIADAEDLARNDRLVGLVIDARRLHKSVDPILQEALVAVATCWQMSDKRVAFLVMNAIQTMAARAIEAELTFDATSIFMNGEEARRFLGGADPKRHTAGRKAEAAAANDSDAPDDRKR